MNLELYRIFYVVAICGNITKASEKLCISQPAITKHIKHLEDYLGVPLFIRTKKGVKLTEAGEKIFLKVKDGLTLLDSVEDDISGFSCGTKGTIRIGISTNLTRNYLINYIKEYHDKFPNISFDISTYPTKELIVMLKSGLIDMIISKLPYHIDNDLEYKKLGKTEYIFVTSDRKELLNRNVNVKELEDYPLLLQESNTNSRESANKFFHENNINKEPSMVIGSASLLVDFVKINLGVGFVTKLYVEKELRNKEIFEIDVNPKPRSIEFGVITLKNNISNYYTKEFFDLLNKIN